LLVIFVGTRNLNHRKNITADPSADSLKGFIVNREVLFVDVRFIFLELMPVA